MIWDTTQRSGKVFFDYNQNAKGKTIASVFSARPSVSATVSMPVKWKALDNTLPSDITILTVPNVLKRHEEPWKDILERGQDLDKILDNLSPINSSSGSYSHCSLERLFTETVYNAFNCTKGKSF